jgi:hypothetical protein
MTQIFKNILLVSGSGRNVGKTNFIREVIAQNADQKLIAVKITPHFHEPTQGLVPIAITGNFRVYQETDLNAEKDSSLFLRAGAAKVFYIQTNDIDLEEAFSIILKQVKPDQPIVTESAALRKYISPGLYVFIQKEQEEVKSSALEMRKLADVIVYSDGEQYSLNPKSIFYNQTWKINDIA